MNYFGTNLDYAGHYFFETDDDILRSSKISFKDIPFNPEYLTETGGKYGLYRGEIRWHSIEDYTICAIEGSCKDNRPDSHSVFWVKEKISFDELKQLILSTPICAKIINQMPFEVKW